MKRKGKKEHGNEIGKRKNGRAMAGVNEENK